MCVCSAEMQCLPSTIVVGHASVKLNDCMAVGASQALHGLLCPIWECTQWWPDGIYLRLISSEGSDYVSLPVCFYQLQLLMFRLRGLSQVETISGDIYKVTKSFPKEKKRMQKMEPSKTSQTRWERHHNTFTPSLHLVAFCQLCTTKNSLHTH